MSFAHPWLLALIALPLLLAAWEWNRGGHPVPVPVDGLTVPTVRWRWRLLRAAQLLPALLLALAIVLVAGPLRQGEPKQARVLTNIELCLDLSGSMTSTFGNGSRYDAAMAAIDDFTRRRAGDAFGLTVFGNEVLRWTPLTQDLAVIRDATPWLRPELMPQQFGGTEIGKALTACLATITAPGIRGGDRMVLLLSDGQSADLDDAQTQELCAGFAQAEVAFFMIFIGDQGGPQSQLYTLASATGGMVIAAQDPGGLRECFAHIDRMRPARLAPSASQPVDDRWPWAVAALVVAALHALTLLGLRYTPW